MCTARLLTVSQHALRWGCVSQHARRGLPGGLSAQGVSAWGWVSTEGCLPRGLSTWGCLPRGVADTPPGEQRQTPPLWTEWQTGVKTLPCRNLVAGGEKVMIGAPLGNAGTNAIAEEKLIKPVYLFGTLSNHFAISYKIEYE